MVVDFRDMQPAHRFLGTLRFALGGLNFFPNMSAKHGDNFYFRAFGNDILGTLDPQVIRKTMMGAAGKGGFGADSLRKIMGETVVTISDQQQWLARRKIVQPAYFGENSRDKSIAYVHEVAVDQTEKLINRVSKLIEQGGGTVEIDPTKIIKDFTLGLIVNLLCKHDLEQEDKDTIISTLNVLVLKVGLSGIMGKVPAEILFGIRLRYKMHKFRKLVKKLITLNNQRTDSETVSMLDVLQLHVDDPNIKFTYEDMIAEILLAFTAGYETTATSLNWLIAILARDPELADKLDSEYMNTGSGSLLEQFGNLGLSKRAFMEVIRLYPIVASLSRTCPSDITVSGIHIPEGTLVQTDVYNLSRLVVEDGGEFNPDREITESVKLIHSLMFGASRVCLGKPIAEIEGTWALSALAHHFKFEALEPEMPEARLITVVGPKGGKNRMVRASFR